MSKLMSAPSIAALLTFRSKRLVVDPKLGVYMIYASTLYLQGVGLGEQLLH